MINTLLHKLNSYKREGLRYIISILFISLMTAVADWLGEKEIIFPEVAALSLGLLVVDKRIWSVSRLMIVVMMSLCALFGVLISRLSALPLIINIGLSFIFTSLCLRLSRTTIIPVTSASMLPIVLHSTSLVYPLAVLVLSLSIVFLQWGMEKVGLRACHCQKRDNGKYNFSLPRWTMMLIALLLIAFIPVSKGHILMIVPPLVVMFIEFCTSSSGFRLRPMQIYWVVVVSAILGAFFQYFVHNLWGFPTFATECLLFTCIFYSFRVLRKSFAPACAIALVPTIINQDKVLLYPLEVAVGAFLFLAVSLLLFLRCYRWSKPQLMYGFLPPFVREHFLPRGNRKEIR